MTFVTFTLKTRQKVIKEKMELVGSVEIADDVQNKVKTVGVRGLNFEKAKELGVFQRIGNLLSVMHATLSASNMIYGHASSLMDDLHGRRNEIAREMNMFEKSYERFLNFWTSYYANGASGREVRHETDVLYHRIMDWAQIPERWQLGEPQRTDSDSEIAIRIHSELDDRVYTFRNSSIDVSTEEQKESWGVLCYDTQADKQTAIYTDIDKASALMVAKRMSKEDSNCIFTAATLRDVTEKRTDVIPFKAFRNNIAVGDITKIERV